MNYNKIIESPTVVNNIHESCYRCYHILKLVIEMSGRGDSKETIEDTVSFFMNYKEPVPPISPTK